MFTLGIFITTASIVFAFIAVGVFIYYERNIEMEQILEEKKCRQAALKKENEYEEFIQHLKDNSNELQELNKKIHDSQINKDIKRIQQILSELTQNISFEEYTDDTIVKFREYILPQFKTLIQKYVKLKESSNYSNYEKTTEKLAKTIAEAVPAFESVLDRAMQDDIVSAGVDAAVFSQYVNVNGLAKKDDFLSIKN